MFVLLSPRRLPLQHGGRVGLSAVISGSGDLAFISARLKMSGMPAYRTNTTKPSAARGAVINNLLLCRLRAVGDDAWNTQAISTEKRCGESTLV